MPESLFCKSQPVTFLKNRLWHSCFPVNFAKFIRTPFLQNTSRVTACVSNEILSLKKACNFIKKRLQLRFFCEHCEILKNTYFEKHTRAACSGIRHITEPSICRYVKDITRSVRITNLKSLAKKIHG